MAAENKRFDHVIPLLYFKCEGPVEAKCDDELTHLMERIWRETKANAWNWGRYYNGHFEVEQALGGGVGRCGCGYHTQFTDYLLTPELSDIKMATLSKAKIIDLIKDKLVVFGYTYESLNKMKKVELVDLICPKYSINIMGMHNLIYHRSQVPANEIAKLHAVIDIYNDMWMRTTYEFDGELEELKFN